MRNSKNNLPKKTKLKEVGSERMATGRSNKENDGLGRTVQLLEQDVQRLSRINQLYRSQIQQLERDNVAIYAQLKDMKIQQQSSLRAHYMELQRCNQQNSQLTHIIAMLEEQLRIKDEERRQVVVINEDLSEKLQEMAGLIEINEDLKADVEKYKIKLLESQRYWLTRTQTYLTNKQVQSERVLMQKQGDFSLKLRLCQQQISLKDRMIQQKNEQIHKLIQYIQQKLN